MRNRFPLALAILLLLLQVCLACNKSKPDYGGIALREKGWLRGDLHLHTTWSDADDAPATLIRITEYLGHPEFIAAHPEYEGNHLDFIAITDHRTIDGHSDPGWTSNKLILIPGEEFGTAGHANTFGNLQFVDHDPGRDGVSLDDYRAAITAAHAQGALFSVNHPFIPDIPWPWDTRAHDAIEIWNSGWALIAPDYTREKLDAWENARGPASPLFKRAIKDKGRGAGMQGLTWYEAHLARGLHVALVGGSDRHTLFMPGFPTTWVRAETRDLQGLLKGIRSRHTFVSRTPVGAQLLVRVVHDGKTWRMGDEIPVPASGVKVKVTVQVGRSAGGLLRLIAGEAVSTDEALDAAPLGQVALEKQVVGGDFTATIELEVKPGSWFYPLVFDKLVRSDLQADQAALVRGIADGALSTGEENYFAIAALLVDLIDTGVVLNTSRCERASWDSRRLQCIPADDNGMGTFFVPDYVDRALNVVMENNARTEWAMGAVGSAVRFVAQTP